MLLSIEEPFLTTFRRVQSYNFLSCWFCLLRSNHAFLLGIVSGNLVLSCVCQAGLSTDISLSICVLLASSLPRGHFRSIAAVRVPYPIPFIKKGQWGFVYPILVFWLEQQKHGIQWWNKFWSKLSFPPGSLLHGRRDNSRSSMGKRRLSYKTESWALLLWFPWGRMRQLYLEPLSNHVRRLDTPE